MTDLDQLKTDALTRIENAPDAAALEVLRIEFLGKQGSISGLMKTLGKMSPEDRQVQGPLLNDLRTAAADAIAARKAVLEDAEDVAGYLEMGGQDAGPQESSQVHEGLDEVAAAVDGVFLVT